MAAIPTPPTIVPVGREFPWGSREDTHMVFAGLQSRCLYHLLAVHIKAISSGIPGMGVADICPMLPKDQLISDVSEVTTVERGRVAEILGALTYGIGTETPDPALQPVISIWGRFLLVPAILLLSSNFPRNLLSLHARVDSRSFDGQSHLFEDQMSAHVEQAVRNRFPRFWTHKFLPDRNHVGEVDLLVVDESTKTILLGELRWLLAPGDPREVNNRKKVCGEKVVQLRKKVVAAREVMAQVLRSFQVGNDHTAWNVAGVVIVDGYTALGAEPRELPVVPRQIFQIGLSRCKGLNELHAWLCSHKWLPQERTHFVSGRARAQFGPQRLEWGTFGVLRQQVYFPDYVERTIKALHAALESH